MKITITSREDLHENNDHFTWRSTWKPIGR